MHIGGRFCPKPRVIITSLFGLRARRGLCLCGADGGYCLRSVSWFRVWLMLPVAAAKESMSIQDAFRRRYCLKQGRPDSGGSGYDYV